MSFHALTGCDSTSSFGGYGKKKCWKVFQQYPHLVSGIGRDGDIDQVEQYVCHLYGETKLVNVDKVRLQLFGKGKKGLELLPPTKDALELRARRANHQAKIWMQADKEVMDISSPLETGAWEKTGSTLSPVWTRIPAIPDACLELVTCGCKTKCKTARCSCFKSGLKCTVACGCDAIDCCNPILED